MAASSQFLDLLTGLSVAVLIDDEHGVCLFANRATEDLLGHEPGALRGRDCWDIADADPLLIKREHMRLLREGFWWGAYAVRTTSGRSIAVRSVAFKRTLPDEESQCVHLLYPRRRGESPHRDRTDCQAQHRCVLQLLTEGLSDDEMAALISCDGTEVSRLVQLAVTAVGARSRTEACVRALKLRLVS